MKESQQIKSQDAKRYKSPEQAIEGFYKVFGMDAKEAKNIYLANNLQDKVPDPCAKKQIFEDRNNIIHSQEGLSYADMESKIQKSLQISTNEDFKIPTILHHVWFSNPADSTITRKTKFKLHNKFFQNNIKKTPDWIHYLWTNDLSYIPSEMHKWCASNKVEIYDIDTITTSDNDFAHNHQFSTLAAKAKTFAEQQEFGRATDIARYLAMYLHGGIYVDGDYKIFSKVSLEKMMQSYNSFFGVERNYDVRIGNAFLAAEKESPIIAKIIELVERNVLDPINAPDYVNYANSHTQDTLVKTGPITLSMAFNAEARPDQDVLLPYGYIYAIPGDTMKKNKPCKKWAKNDNICNEIDVIGDHLFAKTWIIKKADSDFDC